MPVRTGVGFHSVTALVAFLLESATLIAFTVMELEEGKLAGAVYLPVASMVPSVEEPPGVSLTDQVTEVLVAPVTVAVNVRKAPARMLAVVGATEPETAGVGGGGCFWVEEEPDEQAERTSARARAGSGRRSRENEKSLRIESPLLLRGGAPDNWPKVQKSNGVTLM